MEVLHYDPISNLIGEMKASEAKRVFDILFLQYQSKSVTLLYEILKNYTLKELQQALTLSETTKNPPPLTPIKRKRKRGYPQK